MKRILLVLTLLCLSLPALPQAIGRWQVYPSYWKATRNILVDDRVYSLCDGNLLVYYPSDGEVQTLDCLNGLGGVHISYMAYSDEAHRLMLVYADGGIDLMDDQGALQYLPDLKNKVLAGKEVKGVSVHGSMAYLCTGFGIVELDMKEGVFRNTYRLGLSVNGMTTDGSHIFLTTTKGVYVADCSDNLFQVDSWKCVNTSQFYEVYWFDNLLVTRHKQGIYALNAATGKIARLVKGGSFGFLRLTDGMLYWAGSDEVGWCSTTDKAQTVEMDNEWLDVSAKAGTLWVSEGMQGLRCYGVEGNSLQPAAGPVQPNSPAHDLFYRMQWAGDRLLVAGGVNTVESIYNPPTAMYMQHGEWVNLPPLTAEDCPDSYEGMVISNTTSLVQDPADENHHFASLHRNGLCEYRDGQLVHFYHSDNSPLRSILPSVSKYYNYVSCAGLQYDVDGNLWMLCSETDTIVRVMKPEGRWVALYYSEIAGVSMCDDYLLHSSGLVFLNSRRTTHKGFFCFDTRGTLENTIDDLHVLRSTIVNQDGTSYAPNEFYCLTEDLDGRIWCGTDLGLFVINDARAFLDSDFRYEQVKIARNDGSGLADYLLNGVSVSCVTVDGANRKWVGTHSNGVYLISADGTELIHHFTASDSPLLSDAVQCVAVNPVSGMVMIGTDAGLCSYADTAPRPEEELDKDNVTVFPNPVRPDYNGTVVVRGLTMDSEVKILTSSGRLVYSGTSEGGTFAWNGRDAQGRRLASGVYHVVASNAEGKKAIVTRIIFIR